MLNSGANADRMYVGIKKEYGVFNRVYRAYWRAVTLPSLGPAYTITDAAFILTHPNGTTTSRPFSLYKVTESWTESGITGINQPSSTLIMSGVERYQLSVTFSGSSVKSVVRQMVYHPINKSRVYDSLYR
jgi:hypothetical protein